MKKIIRKIYTICFITFDAFIDFLFCIRLLLDLKATKCYPYDVQHIRNIKVLLQFLGNSFDYSAFEYYCLNNEEGLYIYYLSLKHKNSGIFKFFTFIYSFSITRFLIPILGCIIGYRCIEKIIVPINEYLINKIENNFGYEYLREYKKYWNDDKEYYNKIKYKVFFEETLINLCNSWNKSIKKRFIINTDTLFFDIERHF